MDEYEPTPPEGWQRWMQSQLRNAKFVLVICSERYAHSIETPMESTAGRGAAWEGQLILEELYNTPGANTKYLPVVFTAADKAYIPQALAAFTYYDLSTEDGYELLYRTITNQPRTPKPPVGSIRQLLPRNWHEELPVPAGRPVPGPVGPAAGTVSGELSLLAALEAGQWQLAAIKSILPPLEATYQARVESPNFVEFAYSGGDLRIYADFGGEHIFGLSMNVRTPAFSRYEGMHSTDRYSVFHGEPYAIVVRRSPIDANTYAELAKHPHTLGELVGRLGQPSYRAHVHGVGSTIYAFVPQGLLFTGDDQFTMEGPLPSFAEYLTKVPTRVARFAQKRLSHFSRMDDALQHGFSSPKGTYRAGYLSGGVYWDNWILIKRNGKPEVRYCTDYYVVGYAWPNDSQVVYCTSIAGADLYALDAITGRSERVARTKETVTALGSDEPGWLWYLTTGGARHELFLGEKAR